MLLVELYTSCTFDCTDLKGKDGITSAPHEQCYEGDRLVRGGVGGWVWKNINRGALSR